MYVAETWAVKKAHKKKSEVAVMRMLIWMCGCSKLHRISNERIRGQMNVEEISGSGHVIQREERYVEKRNMGWNYKGEGGGEG